MDKSQWMGRSVEELQNYLKYRGVTSSNELKVGLVELCELAEQLGIELTLVGLKLNVQHSYNLQI